MAEKHSPPPRAPLFADEKTWKLHPAWDQFFAARGLKVEKQSYASADPVPKADFDALVDKLRAAKVME